MKSRKTNPVTPFAIAFGIAFFIIAIIVQYFAFTKGGLDIRARATVITKYTCMPRGECTPDVGTVVSNVYCGTSTCLAPKQCCKTTTNVPNSPTPAPTYTCSGCSSSYDYTYATWQQTMACSAGKNPIDGTISYVCQCSCGYNSQLHQWNNCTALCALPGIPMYYCRTDTKLCVMTSNLYAEVITCSANLMNPSYPANKPNSGICYRSLATCQSACK
jgi:hypothetical protein